MTISINGSGTITGLTAGGLPDGTIQPSDLSTGAPTWNTSGNVGIGTSSPSRKLHVYSSEVVAAIVQSTSASNYSMLRFLDGANTVDASSAAIGSVGTSLALYSNGGERARIDSSGNLLVGITASANSPANGICTVSPTAGTSLNVGHANGTPAGYAYMQYAYNGSTIGYISQNGTTAVAYNTTSDYRLKENVQPLSGALGRIAALKPVTYTWKADGSDGEGFIAHELAEVCPQAVTGKKDAVDADGNPVYQGIDTSFLVATLTAAIQEQQAIIQQLTARIETLENK